MLWVSLLTCVSPWAQVPLGRSRRRWALQPPLGEGLGMPHSQNCTVAISADISECLSYQETTRKGKWEDYLGSTSAVFTVHPWKWNWGKAELQSRTGCLVHDILPCPRGPFHSFSFKYLSMDASGCDPPSFCGGWVRKRAFGSTGSFTWSCADGFASAAPG